MSFKLDTSKFERALVQYVPLARKDITDEVNRRSANILMWAIKYTAKASPAIVRAIFAKSSTVTRVSVSKKTGVAKQRQVQKFTRGTLDGYRIANYRRNIRLGRLPTGNPPGGGLGGASMRAYIRKTFKALGSSVGYLKSGWLPALKIFKQSGGASETAKLRGGRGTASFGGGIKAVPAELIRSYFYSTANPRTYASGPVSIDKRLNSALQQAVDNQTRDMLVYIARKLRERADKSL